MPQLAKFQPAVQNAYSLIGSTAVVAAIETDPQTCKPVRTGLPFDRLYCSYPNPTPKEQAGYNT
eukprot:1979056-Amphidinium_carterae.1